MYRKFYSPEEMQWRILLIKCFEPYFLNDRKRGGKKENHLGSQFISMDLFLNAWFKKKKRMWLLVQTNTRIYSLEFFSGCVRLSVGTMIVYLHWRALQVIDNFFFLFWTHSKSAQSTTQINFKAFVLVWFLYNCAIQLFLRGWSWSCTLDL